MPSQGRVRDAQEREKSLTNGAQGARRIPDFSGTLLGVRRDGGEKLHANLKGAVWSGVRMAYSHFGGHGVAVAIHLDGMDGIGG